MAEEEDFRQKREVIPGAKKGKAKNGKGKGKPAKKGKGNKNEPRKGNKNKPRKGNKNKPRKGNRNSKTGKGKRKGNKNRPRKGKNNVGRQLKNGKGKKEGKRSKKKPNKGNGKKNTNTLNGRRKNSVKGTPRATVDLKCLRDAVTYTKFLKDNVVNFLRRNTRLEAQNNLTNKKAGKKGEFKEPAARLIQSGGGDKTNLTCAGSTTGVGAKSMLNVTNTLDACEVSIKKACKPPSANTTFLTECKTNAIKFNSTVTACISKATKGQDACSCFQDSAVAAEKKVLEKCKGTSQGKAAAKARTACLKQISKCKTAATSAGKLQYACNYSKEKLIMILKQLTANENGFKAFLDKIKKLTGLSPIMPGATNTTS